MRLIKDLGTKELVTKKGKTYRKRFGIYECPKCNKEFEANSSNVKSGNTKQCINCSAKTSHVTHGDSTTKLYGMWKDMKKRCNNVKSKQYPSWGGRGITIYPEWEKDYKVYKKYVMALPNALVKGYSIDRIDNDSNYEPGNIRWATRSTQAFNTRTFKSNTSGTRGVSWAKTNGKWLAYITVDGKRTGLGFYHDIEKAKAARKAAEIKYRSIK